MLLDQSNNQAQKPLDEETFKQMLMENFTKAFREGYNQACDVISETIANTALSCKNDALKLHDYELAQLVKKFKLDATGHVIG